MKPDKKSIILILALILLAVSLIYRVLNPFVQQRVESLTFTGKNEGGKFLVAKTIEDPGQGGKQDEPQSLGSRFISRPLIPGLVLKDLFATPQPARKIPENTEAQASAPAAETQNNSLSEARAYLASYKIDGIYESGETKAVFLSKDKLVLVAKVGDRLDGKYLIEDILKDHVRIKALDLNETIDLDLREFNNE